MKTIKSIHTLYLLVSTFFHTALVVFLALPALEEIRAQIAGLAGLPASSLWIPAIVLVVAVHYTILKIFKRTISEPMLHISQEIELNRPGSYAFKSTSRNEEEKVLKHYVESQSLRATEMETQIDDLENERDKVRRELEIALEKTERAVNELEDALTSRSAFREEAEQLKAQNTVLERELESALKSQVGGEVRKRTEEIYAQMERAVEAAAYKKIWLPSVLEELRTPAKLIQDIASRIDRSWDNTPMSKLKLEVEEIRRQCGEQLNLLNRISNRDLEKTTQPEIPSQPANEESEEEPVETSPEPIESEESILPDPTETTDREEESASVNSEPVAEDAAETQQESLEESRGEVVETPEPVEIISNEASTALSEETEIPAESPQSIPAPIPDVIPADPPTAITETELVEDDEEESALELLISEIVSEYEQRAEAFTIELTKVGLMNEDVDEEELGSILSNLLEIALHQFSTGTIRLKAEQTNSFLELTLRCDGHPNPQAMNDVTQANRIASAMDQKVAVDMQKDNALYMHLKYALGYGDDYEG